MSRIFFLSLQTFPGIVQSVSHLPMKEQQERVEVAFTSWKVKQEQVDDALVTGIRVS